MDALLDWLLIAIVFLTQGVLVFALVVLMGLLVVPEAPLFVQSLKWLRAFF